jgi:hypothetical protein
MKRGKFSKKELIEIVDFLRPRALIAGEFKAFNFQRDYGHSANRLVEFALGGSAPTMNSDYPADTEDLRACECCYESAPKCLQERMLPILTKYRGHIYRKISRREVNAWNTRT